MLSTEKASEDVQTEKGGQSCLSNKLSRVRKKISADPNSKRCVVLLTILFIAALIVAPQLLRAFPLGCDPYYYLAYASNPQSGMPPLFFYLSGLPTIPVTLILIAASLFLFYRIAKEARSPNPVLTTALLLGAPVLFLRAAIFEDDLLGLPVSLGLVYAFMRTDGWARWLVIVTTVLLGFQVWRPLWLFAGLFVFWEIVTRFRWAWLTLPMLGVVGYTGTSAAMVGENQPGLLYIPVMLLGLALGITGIIKGGFMAAWAVWFLFLGLLQAKWLWLAVFPLGIILHREVYGKKNYQALMVLVIGLGVVMGSLYVVNAQPTLGQMTDLAEVVRIADGAEINNEWWTGHWLVWLGGNARYTNLSPTPEAYMPGEARYHLTTEVLPLPVIKNYTWVVLYEGGDIL